MTRNEILVLTTEAVVVEEQVSFTLSALCQASGARQDWVHGLVGEGLLQPTGQGPDDWQFSGDALSLTRRALRLARDFELDLAAIGLAMDLLAEIDRLRSRLRHP
jgi:chaperone modulatory protein CbpM